MKPARAARARGGARAPVGGEREWLTPLFLARATLAIAIVLFVPGLMEQFDVPKAALVRVVGVGLLAFLLASLRGSRILEPQPLDLGIAVWLGVEVVTTVTSVTPRMSVLGDIHQPEGLLTSLGLAGLYLAFRTGTRGDRAARSTVAIPIAAATLAGLYALAQALKLDPLTWKGAASYGAEGVLRPGGTLGHANVLGVVVAAALAAAVPMILGDRRGRWILLAAAALFGTVILLTLSRAAWIGAVAGVLTAGALAGFARMAARIEGRTAADPMRMGRREWIVGAALLALGAVTVTRLVGSALGPRLAEFLSPTTGSSRSRLEIWRTAIACWKARPWLGHGPDTLELVATRYQTPEYWRFEWASVPSHAHSVYLHTLATRGVLGFAAGTACAVGLTLALRKAWLRSPESRVILASLAGALVSMGVAGAFGALGVAGAVFVVAALGTVAALAEPPPSPARPPLPGGWIAPAIGLALAVLVAVWAVGDLAASHAAFRARREWAVDPNRAATAMESANRAADARPREDAYQWLRSDIELAFAPISASPDRTLDDAERSARRAISLVPLRALNHRGLGHVLMAKAQRGDRARLAEAEAEYVRSLELAPYDALDMLEFVQSEMALHRPQVALPWAEKAAQLYPRDGLAQGLLAEVSLGVGDRAAAIRALERAVEADWRGVESGRRQARRMLDALRAPG